MSDRDRLLQSSSLSSSSTSFLLPSSPVPPPDVDDTRAPRERPPLRSPSFSEEGSAELALETARRRILGIGFLMRQFWSKEQVRKMRGKELFVFLFLSLSPRSLSPRSLSRSIFSSSSASSQNSFHCYKVRKSSVLFCCAADGTKKRINKKKSHPPLLAFPVLATAFVTSCALLNITCFQYFSSSMESETSFRASCAFCLAGAQ